MDRGKRSSVKGMRSRRTPFPARPLALAAALHLALLAGLGWYILSSLRSIAALQSQEFYPLDRMNAIAQASENRANSAQVGVAAADPRWRGRHRDLRPHWNSALAELRRLAPSEFGSEAGRRLTESAAELFRIEEQALDLALQGKGEMAEALLLAKPYNLELRTFSLSSEQIRGWLGDRLRLVLDSQRRRAGAVKTMLALACPVLLCL